MIYKKKFEGIIPNLKRRYHETDSHGAREEIKAYMNFTTCPQCEGSRLNQASSAVQVAGRAIPEITKMSVEKCLAFFRELSPARKGSDHCPAHHPGDHPAAGVFKECGAQLPDPGPIGHHPLRR